MVKKRVVVIGVLLIACWILVIVARCSMTPIEPTITPTLPVSATPSNTPIITPSATGTAVPSSTPSPSHTPADTHTPIPTGTAVPTFTPIPATATPKPATIYTVEEGDTITGITGWWYGNDCIYGCNGAYGGTVRWLIVCELNKPPVERCELIQPGWQLVMPDD